MTACCMPELATEGAASAGESTAPCRTPLLQGVPPCCKLHVKDKVPQGKFSDVASEAYMYLKKFSRTDARYRNKWNDIFQEK